MSFQVFLIVGNLAYPSFGIPQKREGGWENTKIAVQRGKVGGNETRAREPRNTSENNQSGAERVRRPSDCGAKLVVTAHRNKPGLKPGLGELVERSR